MILETATSKEQTSETVIWRQEARYRLKEGKGIRVFSRPEKLKEWLEANGLTLQSRRHLITDAGEIADGFTLHGDGIEFFCHSPFVRQVDEGEDLRNSAALVFSIRFRVASTLIEYFAVGDSDWEVLEDIVRITKKRGNDDRLCWDLYNIPHHCSYKALSDEKGEDETTPKPLVKDLLMAGRQGCFAVSSSEPIPDTEQARRKDQPPHIQARRCYERHLEQVDGSKLLVTMEESDPSNPKPIIFVIDANGLTHVKEKRSAAAIITSRPAPRAGA
jgi:hypothetical protein